MEEKTDKTKKDGRLKNKSVLSIVIILVAGSLILVSLIFNFSFEIFFKITLNQLLTFLGYVILMFFLINYLYTFSSKENYLKGYVYLPIMVFLFQFISCGDDLNFALKGFYIVGVFLIFLITTNKISKEKRKDLLAGFNYSLSILVLSIAFIAYIYLNTNQSVVDFIEKNNPKKYFSTSAFIISIITFFCCRLQFMIDTEERTEKTLTEKQKQDEAPKQKPALIETPSPKEEKKTTQTTITQTDANKVTLKEVRETFYHLRDFEISNLWQRSVFLTAFLVLLFTGYGYVVSSMLKNEFVNILIFSEICCGIGLAGFAFSIIWIMMAKGSKAWYEIYERRISDIEKENELGIPEKYRMGSDMRPWSLDSNIFTKKAGKYSVSKLNIIIGIILLLIWFFVCVIHYIIALSNCSGDNTLHIVILTLLPVAFLIIIITAVCNFWAKSSSIQNPSDYLKLYHQK